MAHRYPDDPLFAFDSIQYLQRFEEHGELSFKLYGFMKEWTGLEGHVAAKIVRAVDECLRDHEGDAQRWVELSGQALREASALIPEWLRTIPPMACAALLERVQEMLSGLVRNEVLAASAANRPAREPNFERLLAMDLINGWSERRAAPRERS